MDPSVAVVVPSVGEKSEIADGVDVVDPLVSSTSSLLGSPAIDNKLRFTTSVENASAAVAIAKVSSDMSYTAFLLLSLSLIYLAQRQHEETAKKTRSYIHIC